MILIHGSAGQFDAAALAPAQQQLLTHFNSMDDRGREEVMSFAAFVETQAKRRRPRLALVVGVKGGVA